MELPNDTNKLSKLIEEVEHDLDALRVMAFRYQKSGQPKIALRLYRLILALDPDAIESYRYMAATLLDRNQVKEAWEVYITFLNRRAENIDNASLGIIYNDMERLYHAYDMKEVVQETFESKASYASHPINEMRIIFEWTVPNESLRIEVINPKNQIVSFPLGSNSTMNVSIQDFFIDGTYKGEWKINLSLSSQINFKGTLKITTYPNWLSSKQFSPKTEIFILPTKEKSKYKLLNLHL